MEAGEETAMRPDGTQSKTAPAKPADVEQPPPLLFGDTHRPIADRAGWEHRRRELMERWRSFLGVIPPNPQPPKAVTVREDRLGQVVRRLVRYESEPGEVVEAYLLEPAEAKAERGPGVVVLHSTVDHTIRQPAGLEGPPEMHVGLRLAEQGYTCVCPRCFLWPEGRAGRYQEAVARHARRHPGVTGMAKMLFDARRAVDLLATLPGVDPTRLGAFGHSLGAKEALYLAAFDDRIRAAVSSEGGIGLTYTNWDAPWYLGEAIRRPGFPLDHAQVLALVAPRAFLLIGGDSADGEKSRPFIDAARPVWALYGKADALDLLNHRRGHAFPAEAQRKAYTWFDRFLKAG